MIEKYKYRDFIIYTKKNQPQYRDILESVLKYDVKVIKVFRNIDDTKVSLIDTPYGKYIYKVFAPKVKRTERFLKSFIRGDYYKNLIEQTDRVRESGNLFPNDFYFLAERKIFNYASVFIMLIEYIEGTELSELDKIDDNIRAEIKESMEVLHRQGMLSGDPHKGNFIISNSGVRIIDLSGKSCSAQLKAKDRIAMEKHLNIKNEIFDFGYKMVMLRLKFRNLIKTLKGKK